MAKTTYTNADIARIMIALSEQVESLADSQKLTAERLSALEARLDGKPSKKASATASKPASKPTQTSKKSDKPEREYGDASFEYTQDADALAIGISGADGGYLNKAARAYIRIRILNAGKKLCRWNDKHKAYVFESASEYKAACKRIKALKGIVKQADIKAFVENGWA